MGIQQKWIPVLRDNAPQAERAPVIVVPADPHQSDLPFHLHPKRDHSCPAITIKTTLPRAAGVIGHPAARAAPARHAGPTRNSPSAISPERATARSGPTPPSPTARSPIPARANPMPASAKVLRRAAMVTRRAVIMATRRVHAAIGRLPIVRSASTGMIVLAATTAAAKSAPTPRGAKVFARTATDRAAIGLRENSAATRNSRAARRIARATGGIARATGGIARATGGIARATGG